MQRMLLRWRGRFRRWRESVQRQLGSSQVILWSRPTHCASKMCEYPTDMMQKQLVRSLSAELPSVTSAKWDADRIPRLRRKAFCPRICARHHYSFQTIMGRDSEERASGSPSCGGPRNWCSVGIVHGSRLLARTRFQTMCATRRRRSPVSLQLRQPTRRNPRHDGRLDSSVSSSVLQFAANSRSPLCKAVAAFMCITGHEACLPGLTGPVLSSTAFSRLACHCLNEVIAWWSQKLGSFCRFVSFGWDGPRRRGACGL